MNSEQWMEQWATDTLRLDEESMDGLKIFIQGNYTAAECRELSARLRRIAGPAIRPLAKGAKS